MTGAGAHAEELSKEVVSYRDHPDGRKNCSNCSHYSPASEPANPGRCSIVAGPVGPRGYCIVWAARHPTDGC